MKQRVQDRGKGVSVMRTPQEPKKNLIVSGQFAAICGVNKQTLLYYDKIGLFSPGYKGENGIRYTIRDR